MLLLLGTVLGGLSFALILRAIFHDRLQGNSIVGRIGVYTSHETPIASKGDKRLDQLAALIGERFSNLVDEQELRSQIMAAGLYSLTPTRLIGYRALAMTAPPLVWLAFASSSHVSPLLIVAGLALAIGGGWRAPTAYLQRQAKARQNRIDYELPSLVDLLVVTIEAGVSLGGSLQMASERLKGPLRDELKLSLKEQQMGLTVEESLKNLLRRVPTPTVTAFVRSLTQGESLGVSIGKIMRDLAVDMRKRRKAAAEEKAQKAPVKMLFPLVLLIFPSMLAVLLGPAVIEMLKTFSSGG
jgi:tight adherence protein C